MYLSCKKSTPCRKGFVWESETFLDMIEHANPGSRTCVVTKDGEFQRAFLCPSMCVRAFQNATHVISLDACHFKARYGGVVLVLTVLDGNGNVFPAAIGIAESENEETWSWFLFTAREALHVDDGGNGLVVLSDREKGIDNAVKKSFPVQNTPFVCSISRKCQDDLQDCSEWASLQSSESPNKGCFPRNDC